MASVGKTVTIAIALVLLNVLGAHAQNVTTLIAQIRASGGVSFGPDGYIYAAHWTNEIRSRFGSPNEGWKVWRVSTSGESSLFVDLSDYGRGLTGNAFGPDSILYQAIVSSDVIVRISPGGVVARHADVPEPYGLVAADNGDVYAISVRSATKSVITRIRSDGTTEDIVDFPSTKFALTMDDESNFYVTDLWRCGITRVSSDLTLTDLGCMPDILGNHFLTFANDRIYVAGRKDAETGVIYEVTPGGDMRHFVGGDFDSRDGPIETAAFRLITGLAASHSGDTLFVAESLQAGSGGFFLLARPNKIRMITAVLPTGAENDRPSVGSVQLEPAYPNPVTVASNIPFVLGETRHVRLELYDILGRHVRTLLDGIRPPGRHEIGLIATDLVPGAYVVRLDSETETLSRVMVVHQRN